MFSLILQTFAKLPVKKSSIIFNYFNLFLTLTANVCNMLKTNINKFTLCPIHL